MGKQTEFISSKIKVVYIGMFLMAAMLVIFSFRWQVIEVSRFQAAAGGRNRDDQIRSLRGAIYASDESTLAYSEPRWNVHVWIPELLFAERKGLQTRVEFSNKVAPLIDMSPERLRQIITESEDAGYLYPKIASKISIEVRSTLKSLNRDPNEATPKVLPGFLTGYDLTFTSDRLYPEGRLASQILGLTNVLEDGETIGLSGLEGEWDGYLEPQIGFIQGERDAVGNAIGVASKKTIEAKRGSSVYTTIDKKLQGIVEKKLKWSVNHYKAKSGTIVIMDPKTGYILSLANYPDYNPNLREERNAEVYGNKAVSEPYEIGSVGKVLTLAAAVEGGVVTPDTILLKNGHKGCEKIHEDLQPVCTHDKLPQPAMSIAAAFAKSDNIYFLHLAEAIEKKEPGLFYEYLDKFGIGKPTGIDIAGESFGFMKDWQLWNIGDISAYSYGHSYQANSIQAVSSIATVANYGVRMQPKLVKKIVESDGSEIDYLPLALEKVVSAATTKKMDKMMGVVFQNNIFPYEWQYEHLRDYKIALKSGTALIPFRDRPGYSNSFNATYIGYDATPCRSFIMLTRLEDPKVGTLASHNSRVLWLETFDAIKGHLGVPIRGACNTG